MITAGPILSFVSDGSHIVPLVSWDSLGLSIALSGFRCDSDL